MKIRTNHNDLSRELPDPLSSLHNPDDPNVKLVFAQMNLTDPGVGGTGLLLDVSKLPKEEAEKFQRSLEQREYSSYTSSLIPLQRSLPDIRLKGCHSLYTDLNLPETSVVIIFYNEHWSVLVRTIHSVMDNTPPHLIKEIILVDDASTDKVLKEPLKKYVSRFKKVRIVRAKSNVGLTRARMIGFEQSTAPVAVFMDGHCECFPGWLEPLVTRIAENQSIITTPNLHAVNPKSFKIIEWGQGRDMGIPILGFPNIFFTWSTMSEEEWRKRKRETDPVRSPAMVGCVIAVSRRWFKKLGMFDPGLEIWGGHPTELAIKTWLCGGGLEIIPCSNVAHLYHPHRPSEKRRIAYNRNIARISNVWLDKYKHFSDNYDGSIADFGDISDRIALRDSLKCHPFEFYLTDVNPYQFIPGNGIYTGLIRNVELGTHCFDSGGGKNGDSVNVLLYSCHGQGNQLWDFTERREIRVGGQCLDSGYGDNVVMRNCHGLRRNQEWEVVSVEGQVLLESHGYCVGVTKSKSALVLEKCQSSALQRWTWKHNREPRIS
ncbi:polypeptide N-acetylgalactosaminyltransferase 5-like [Haliotis rubra]|uniref:polypeptide N-acetylgalactosaminyltransferase 5-like n=1 Tax=Haliotis rubra TaxID=36100 RepID=UPI001EE5B415|nr:polypeptide N-acetylgalactosaminyltransferase 5-like [Haliotis rubra]